MRRAWWMCMWAGVLGLVTSGGASAGGEEAEVLATTDAWVEAFNTRDAVRIAALYAPDAVFWGTVSKTIRTTPAEVLEYFIASAANRPRLRIQLGERHVRMLGEGAFVAGYYTSTDPKEGGDLVTPLRFTFVYAKRDGAWVIISHHSSRMP